jgi:hypothetical protein
MERLYEGALLGASLLCGCYLGKPLDEPETTGVKLPYSWAGGFTNSMLGLIRPHMRREIDLNP